MSESQINTIREAVVAAVERSSLRAVARDVDVSASGLRKFIEGAEPYTPTLKKLRRWHAGWAGDDPGRRLLDAVSELAALVMPGERARVRDEILQVMATAELVQPVRAASLLGAPKPKHRGSRPGHGGAPMNRPPVPRGHFLCTSCDPPLPVPVSQWMEHVSRHGQEP
ncbi:hypothetical protein [Longimicrobium sp.]|jgi:hypothetical protein|uniref:hypothetical protein n=1 Tax=Longimicrobium sp. TaxID=2029185 RepID=UPI002F94EDCF